MSIPIYQTALCYMPEDGNSATLNVYHPEVFEV